MIPARRLKARQLIKATVKSQPSHWTQDTITLGLKLDEIKTHAY
jgi:hypothetical protein